MSIDRAWFCSECEDMEYTWDKPNGVKCPICTEEFCCDSCVESHILKEHPDSLEAIELEEGL